MNMSSYFRLIWLPSLPSMTPIEPINIASCYGCRLINENVASKWRKMLTPIGAMSSWSAATLFDNARTLTGPVLLLQPQERKGK